MVEFTTIFLDGRYTFIDSYKSAENPQPEITRTGWNAKNIEVSIGWSSINQIPFPSATSLAKPEAIFSDIGCWHDVDNYDVNYAITMEPSYNTVHHNTT